MREYLFAAVIACAVTYLSAPLFRVLAIRAGAMAPIRSRDVHTEPTPRWGGLAMVVGLAVGLLAADHLPLLHKAFAGSNDPLAIVSGALVVALLGVADDLWHLDALTKLAGQALAAGVMVIQGVQLLWIPINGVIALPATLGAVATVLVVVVAINAVNFVDGLDGLAAGIVAIAATAFFAFSYLLAVVHGFSRAGTATLITALIVGVCLGFLPHNISPAKIFMGDSGSMLLGYLLAASAVSITGQLDANALSAENLAPVFLPLILTFAVLAVPLLDLGWAIIRRTATGRSPFTPDKQHLHHRLLRLGHSHRRASGILYLWTASIAFPVTAMAFVTPLWAILGAGIALEISAFVTFVMAAQPKAISQGASFERATLKWAGSLSGGWVIFATLTCLVARGRLGFVSAILGGALVLLFFGLSLELSRRAQKMAGGATFAWAGFSYIAKIAILGPVVLLLRPVSWIDHGLFGVTAITAALLWLMGEIAAFFRTRLLTITFSPTSESMK